MDMKEIEKLIKKTKKTDTTYVRIVLTQKQRSDLISAGYRVYSPIGSDNCYISWRY